MQASCSELTLTTLASQFWWLSCFGGKTKIQFFTTYSIHVSKSETPLNPCFKSLFYFGIPNFQIEILLKWNSVANWAVSIRVNMSIELSRLLEFLINSQKLDKLIHFHDYEIMKWQCEIMTKKITQWMLISDIFLIAALKFPQDQPNCFSERHGKKCNFSLNCS